MVLDTTVVRDGKPGERRSKAWLGFAFFMGMTSSADVHALALGEIEVQSYLNEPFVATVRALATSDERILNDCITLTLPPGQDPRETGINYLRDATVEVLAEGEQLSLTIRSRRRIVDPVLALVLRVDCQGSGTFLREYTALLDPRLPRGLQPAYARATSPVRVDAPPVVPSATGSGSWRVRPGQTLSRIAAELAPGDRRAQARLVEAIVANNPDVFPDGDPNRLPAGAVLKLPEGVTVATGEETKTTSPASAGPSVATSAKTSAASPVPRSEATPRLTLTNSEQVTDLQSASETARMVAESRRLLVETEAQYADTEALKARLQRLEKQIALLERALVVAERAVEGTQTVATGGAVEVPDTARVNTGSAVAMVVSPTTAATEQKAPIEIAGSGVPAPQIEHDVVRRDYVMWIGGILLAGLVLLFWRLRRRPSEEQEAAAIEWQMDRLVPETVGAAAHARAGALSGEKPELPHKEAVFAADPLAGLPEYDEPEEEAAAADVGAEDVPTLEHEATQQIEQQELMVEKFDFEEHDTAAKAEVGNVLVRAEFYLLLRQPENAIKLLRENIEGDEPLHREPALWLMLLRVYRQERMRESFEKLLAEFNGIFNIAVPEWNHDAKTAEGHSLENDFPRLLNRVVQLWDSNYCEEFLDNLLHDNRDGTRRGFDMSIAEELLLLKGVWRIREAL